MSGAADPAVLRSSGVELCGKGPFVAGGEIGLDVFDFAHAGNDGADVGIVQDKAKAISGMEDFAGTRGLSALARSTLDFRFSVTK